mmetsp:Transcript_42120/g.103636  ORF Transcript_42120/g.103636 Transcript_42120/m.103636 type:complete len:238 (-) Transcript_42120:552-1265(-)
MVLMLRSFTMPGGPTRDTCLGRVKLIATSVLFLDLLCKAATSAANCNSCESSSASPCSFRKSTCEPGTPAACNHQSLDVATSKVSLSFWVLFLPTKTWAPRALGTSTFKTPKVASRAFFCLFLDPGRPRFASCPPFSRSLSICTSLRISLSTVKSRSVWSTSSNNSSVCSTSSSSRLALAKSSDTLSADRRSRWLFECSHSPCSTAVRPCGTASTSVSPVSKSSYWTVGWSSDQVCA